MQQQAATHPPTSGTGPGGEATTSAEATFDPGAGDCHATAVVYVTHDAVHVTAVLNMGMHQAMSQRWERRSGPGKGWKLIEGPCLWTEQEDRLSTELAEYLDGLDFPFALANMLPRRPTAAAIEAITAAAKEVGDA